ncbi:MAG: sugar ABC transporter substrate-binding protein [Planctomycetes bacterium]|nr:sugar ABC transporter substrate-binding protein [Planctomycetota bacterium]
MIRTSPHTTVQRRSHFPLFHIAALFTIGIFLSGCTRSVDLVGKVEIKFLCPTVKDWERYFNTAIDLFHKKQSRIRVRMIGTGGAGLNQKFLAMVASGQAPDVSVFDETGFIPHAAKGYLVNLDRLIEEDKTFHRDDFYPEVLKTGEYNGTLYGFPLFFSTIVLFYNKALFDEAGVAYPDESWTLDDLVTAAKKMTRDTDGDDKTDQYGFMLEMGTHRWPIPVWAFGGRVVDDEKKRFLLDTPEAVQGVQWYADLVNKHHVAPPITSYEDMNMFEQFATGRIAMTMSSRHFIGIYRRAKGLRWDVAPVPKQRLRATTFISTVLLITRSSRHPKEAWEFIKFASGREAMEAGAREKGAIPALRAVAESSIVRSSGLPPEHDRVFLDMIPYARLPNFSRICPNNLGDYGKFLSRMDQIWLGIKTAAEVLGEETPRINRAIAESEARD